MIELHRQLEAEGVHVYRCDKASWNTRSPGHAANFSRVIGVAQTAAANHQDAQRIVLGAASFGNRVLAELLRTRFHDLPPQTCFALPCGYPLHALGKPEGADPRRAAHLTQLPAVCHVLFVQGNEDGFLGPRGIVALRDVAANMSARSQIHEVAGGTHVVPEAKGLAKLGLSKAQVVGGVRDAILGFLACPEGEPLQAAGSSGVAAGNSSTSGDAAGGASASVVPSPPKGSD